MPPLWDAVRYKVDQTAQKGQFILTGSATPNHKGILHSGAGRIRNRAMRPMSLWESGDSSGKVSLEQLCHGELTPAMTGEGGSEETNRTDHPGRLAREPGPAVGAGGAASYPIPGRRH